MVEMQATNAKSSGVSIDPATLRDLMSLRNGPGLRYMSIWFAMLAATGYGVFTSTGTAWIYPAFLAYATVLTVPSYAVSHESAHGTFVKTKWLNRAICWIMSLIYFEDPVHRYNAHMRHHNFTWINDYDAQMPYTTPMYFRHWLLEISGLGQLWYDGKYLILNAVGHHDTFIHSFTPERDLPRQRRAAQFAMLVYAGVTVVTWLLDGWGVLLMYIVLPRIVGGFAMQAFTIVQHAEMAEDQHDIRKSCRSFNTTWLGRFLYCHINYHIEHHLYPKVPFHALPALQKALGDQLPHPTNGLFTANLGVLAAVLRRTFRRSMTNGQSI